MKYTLTIAVVLLIGQQAMSQLPEDVIRLNYNVPSGTARNQALGGAGGSLGGEITSTFINPAGLGFYKLSEMVITPGFTLAKSSGDYLGMSSTSDNTSRFNMSTTGFVSATNTPGRKWVSKAFSIGVNRMANFNNSVYYKGNNDFSSSSEVYAEEFANSGVSLDEYETTPYLSLGTKSAIHTYLIDTATIDNVLQVVGRPEYLNSVNQEYSAITRGGITEIALGYAGNLQDKFYVGGSIGVPILKYERRQTFTETDPSGDTDNDFGYSRYEEKLTTTGVGLNAKLGIIFKPANQTRIGVAIHTPTIYGLKDVISTKMVTDLEQLFAVPVDSVTSDFFGGSPEYKYDMSSPWRFLVSGSYIFNEVEDVTRQRGFITADVEYVTYGSTRFSAAEATDDDGYFDDVNKVVKQDYKGAFNFRLGGELKFNTLMTRLGFAYYGNPYKADIFEAGKTNISGGLGYRDKGIFVDLTYVHSISRDVNIPYRLPEGIPYANIKSNIGQILLTFGFKI